MTDRRSVASPDNLFPVKPAGVSPRITTTDDGEIVLVVLSGGHPKRIGLSPDQFADLMGDGIALAAKLARR